MLFHCKSVELKLIFYVFKYLEKLNKYFIDVLLNKPYGFCNLTAIFDLIIMFIYLYK